MDGINNSPSLSKKDVRATTAEKLKGMLKAIDKASAGNAKNGFCARSRIATLFDEGTFVEMGAYVKRKQNAEEFEGVICGYGAISGKLAFAFSQDSTRMKGAFDESQAKKITALYASAIKNGAPVIGFFDSCGAIVYDGVSALAGYGSVMKCVSDASGVIPQIAVISGVCAGSAATIASMFDAVVTVKDSTSIYTNSPFLLGDEVGSADYASKNGLSAKNVSDEAQACDFVRKLIELFPSNNAEGISEISYNDSLNRTVDIDSVMVEEKYEIKDILNLIGDGCRFTELYDEFAPEIVIGLTSFGGIVTGIVANRSSVNGGALTVAAARKAAKFISLCDSFNIPLLTLVDSVGLEVSQNAEGSPYATELARLAFAYTSSENAKITVVLGKAYGAAYTLMGSKSIGADIAFALNSSAISVLPPESAVAFVWNDRVSGNEPAQAREELEKAWTELCASPVDAAEKGEIDDIIESAELRQRICACISMLVAKSEIYPDRRHIVLPM